ncbi:MAG TPA: ABC transporter permease subunit [Dongiaceae bacterium]|jgi:glycine betaine/proline transport system permease protein|nr:ABC transporter permease subunit [Dongiaceae bacterium]
MTDIALGTPPRSTVWPAILWAALLTGTIALGMQHQLAPWAADYPKSWVLPLAREITVFAKAIIGFITPVTRAISAGLQMPLDFAIGLFAKGFAFGSGENAIAVPRLSWIGVLAVVALIGHAFGGRRTAWVAFLCFFYLALFGQWDRAMLTLALVAVCVPVGVLLGLILGVAAYRHPRFDFYFVRPLLDLMQTIPAFAYIIPTLFLFGFTPVTPLIATVAFAMPPMVRATTLALHRVPTEIQELGRMTGCTRRQMLWRILLPSAKPTLMIGVNQVIMLTLNMVIIASMVGADGLGYDVLFALRGQKIGVGLETGLAITALAIALDRLSQAAADAKPELYRPGTPFHRRHPYLLAGIAMLIATTALGQSIPVFAGVPQGMTVTTAPMWDALVKWINVNYFDYFDAVRTALLLHVLNPIKQALLALPWVGAVLIVAYAGWRLRNRNLALLCGALIAFIAAVGMWDKAMTTIYLCAISATFSCLLGIPLGVIATRSQWFDRVQRVVVDTLQTLPSFVYLIPVVMLFRVGDVTALIAIVAFAITPAVRYTIHGIRQVPAHLIEAAVATGCTRWQILWRVQIPLALPEIMLGINQTILFALSMLVITALVGTRDLGQEVYFALTKVDTGRGIIAGLCVAFLGIVADRLLRAAADRFRRRLGISPGANIG